MTGHRESKWDTFKQAVMTKWKSEDLNSMQAQLTQFRSQLSIRLLAAIKATLEASAAKQAGRFDEIDRKGDEIVDVLAFHHQSLTSRLEEHTREVKSTNRALIEAVLTYRTGGTTSVILDTSRSKNVSTALSKTLRSRNAISIRGLPEINSGELGIGNLDHMTSRILSCLSFRQMRERVESITEAHSQTFRWIFDGSKTDIKWDNFPQWLENGEGCYWVNGKAGSGKSTLMNFIRTRPEKSSMLEKWAAGLPLITASFFFWYLGSPLQKSQAGLLRSLLHDVLVEAPHLIPAVMPELCQEVAKNPHSTLGDPSIGELTRWFRNLACNLPKHQQTRFCLFIDGLDEFVGDYPDLAEFLVSIVSKSKHLKLVVSSRPLPAFTTGFRNSHKLRLQDITEEDIRNYTSSKLRTRLVSRLRNEWANFLDEIVSKAAGVFLWVSLVVKSLLEGLRDGDTVSELRARLDEIPPDLKDLYQHMLDRIPQNYQQQASEIFQIILTNVSAKNSDGLMPRITLLELAFALNKSQFPLQMPLEVIPRKEKKELALETEARLRARCLGLFEVHYLRNRRRIHKAPIEFIHRTAVEFLSTEKVIKTLGSPTGFDPLLCLFQTCLWMGRSIPIVKRPTLEQAQETWRYLRHGLEIASLAEINGAPIAPELVGELDRLYTARWEKTAIYWTGISSWKPIPRPSSWMSFMFNDTFRDNSKTDLALDSLMSGSQDIIHFMNISNSSYPINQRLIHNPLTLLVGIRYSLSSYCRHALHGYRLPPSRIRELTIPTLCLQYFIRGLSLGVFDDIVSNQRGPELQVEICRTLFRSGASPNTRLIIPDTEIEMGTPWTLLAGHIFREYDEFLGSNNTLGNLDPYYQLFEPLTKLFVEKGASISQAINVEEGRLGDFDQPLGSHLGELLAQCPNPQSEWHVRALDSLRRVQKILDEAPQTTRAVADPNDEEIKKESGQGDEEKSINRLPLSQILRELAKTLRCF